MKKAVVATLALLAIMSCQNNGPKPPVKESPTPQPSVSITPPPPPTPAETASAGFKACNEYMPLVPGSTEKYSILYSSGIHADVTSVVDALPGNQFQETTQIVDETGGSHKLSLTKTVYACDGGKVRLVSQAEDNKVETNNTHVEMKYTDPAIAMIEASGLRKGTTWSYDLTEVFQMAGQAPIPTNSIITTSFSVEGPEDISVPAGTFKTIKIVRKVGTTSINEYYARGIGMVKRVTQDGSTWSLKEYGGINPME